MYLICSKQLEVIIASYISHSVLFIPIAEDRNLNCSITSLRFCSYICYCLIFFHHSFLFSKIFVGDWMAQQIDIEIHNILLHFCFHCQGQSAENRGWLHLKIDHWSICWERGFGFFRIFRFLIFSTYPLSPHVDRSLGFVLKQCLRLTPVKCVFLACVCV